MFMPVGFLLCALCLICSMFVCLFVLHLVTFIIPLPMFSYTQSDHSVARIYKFLGLTEISLLSLSVCMCVCVSVVVGCI